MKKVFAITVAAALLLGITALAYGAAPEKATGGIEFIRDQDRVFKVTFNVHEGSGVRPAKGVLNVWRTDGPRRFRFDVKYVNVDPANDKAYFAGKCTYDSQGDQTDEWFYVYVHDGGSPGTAGDEIGWIWCYGGEGEASGKVDSSSLDLNFILPVTKGNLVVHLKAIINSIGTEITSLFDYAFVNIRA